MALLIIVAYITWIYELAFLAIPSVASNKAILKQNDKPFIAKAFHIMLSFFYLIAFLLPLIFILDPIFTSYSFALFKQNALTKILGILVLLMGRFISIWATIQISKNNDHKREHSLQIKGLYKYSRNPIVISNALFLISMFVLFGSLIFPLGLICYLWDMHIKILIEEEFLKNQYDEDYNTYLHNTRRYL